MTNESKLSYTSQIVLFSIIGVLFGGLVRDMKSRGIKIPYTPIILSIGILYGTFSEDIFALHKSTHWLYSLHPQSILMIFLPILIFESSYNSDYYIFKRCLWQILVLAIIGVIIVCVLIAGTMKYILNYDDEDLSWSAALTFGAIAAATDPIAIIALLKELNANPYFTAIIEGESLLNDGTAVVFFSIFFNIMIGGKASVASGFGDFWYLCLGGIIIGLVIGFLSSLWLERTKDGVLTISILFASNYLTLFLSDQYDCSGILALTTYGLYMAALGKTKIFHAVEEAVHTVITWLQYVAETLIFLIAGGIIGLKIAVSNSSSITTSDWGKMVVFFIINIFIRMIMVFVLIPFMNKSYYKPNWKEYFMMGYAGLRGALALALSLMVQSDKLVPERTGELILFYVASLSVLSVLLNGMTASVLVKLIKMIPRSRARRSIFLAVIDSILKSTKEFFYRNYDNNKIHGIDWDEVKQLAGIEDEFNQTSSINPIPIDEILVETRRRILNKSMSIVWEHYNSQLISSDAALLVDTAVRVNKENLHRPINMFEVLYQDFIQPTKIKAFNLMSKLPWINIFSKNLMVDQVILMYDISRGLINLLEEIEGFLLELPLPKGIVQKVENELLCDKKEALFYTSQLESQFPSIINFINTKRAAIKIISEEQNILNQKMEVGVIDSEEASVILNNIHKKLKEMKEKTPTIDKEIHLTPLVTRFPAFNLLSEDEINIIKATSKIVKYKSGVTIIDSGVQLKHVYLILSGQVEYSSNSKINTFSVGRILPPIHMIHDESDFSKISCKAASFVRLQQIDLRSLRKVMKTNPKFEEEMMKFSLPFILDFKTFNNSIENKRLEILFNERILKTSEIIRTTENEVLKLEYGGILFTGEIQSANIANQSLLLGMESICCKTNGFILKFGEDVETTRMMIHSN